MPERSDADADTMESAVYQASGAASTAWENVKAAGVPGRAGLPVDAGVELLARLNLGYDDGTMIKVYNAIHSTGVNDDDTIGIIGALQNAGIYFREIKGDILPASTTAVDGALITFTAGSHGAAEETS